MMYLFLIGVLFLGWSFGRNNLSNVFGTAIGTRMVSFHSAAILAAVFIVLGALFSSGKTTDAMRVLATVSFIQGAFWVSLSIALTFLFANRFGVPVSTVQSSVGALIGWNLFFHAPNNWPVIREMIGAWFYCPLVAILLAMIIFYLTRFLLQHIRIPLLYRDFGIRILLIVSGIYTSYFLGANNMPAVAGPYLNVDGLNAFGLICLASIFVAIGILMADKRVISTMSSGLYPLSPMEALVVVFSCGLTLYCFSGTGLKALLQYLNLPVFPLVPIPTSSILAGSIVGVGLVKGRSAIKLGSLAKIVSSWFWIPIISGLICYVILFIFIREGIAL